MSDFVISVEDTSLISSIVDTIEDFKTKQGNDILIISFEKLYELLSKEEIELIKRFLLLKPQKYGFNGEWLGIVNVPADLVALDNQKYVKEGQEKMLPVQFLPHVVAEAYKKLHKAITDELGKSVLVESGYRSPAYQILTLLYYLKFNEFNLEKTLQRVAMPGYSEHTYPGKQAVDFMTEDGVPTDEKPLLFARKDEYKWLLKNAATYNFFLSYPENNNQGIMYEPWHWHHGI